jgi:hypothetical protein
MQLIQFPQKKKKVVIKKKKKVKVGFGGAKNPFEGFKPN